jgi:CMP-N,N'-diacetyllegionaminic acid synthase
MTLMTRKHGTSIAAIIPARGGSKGIPGKNIKLVGGLPLVSWSVLRAAGTAGIGQNVYVTSDSEEILKVAETAGAKSIMRPPELSGDTASSESALIHAIKEIETSQNAKLDVIVFLQCTSPIRSRADIGNALEHFFESGCDSLFSSHPIRDFFIWEKSDDSYFSTNFDYKNRPRRQDIPVRNLENGSIYIFRRDLIMNTGIRLGGKIATYEMDKIHSMQIDSSDELELCDYFLKKFYPVNI